MLVVKSQSRRIVWSLFAANRRLKPRVEVVGVWITQLPMRAAGQIQPAEVNCWGLTCQENEGFAWKSERAEVALPVFPLAQRQRRFLQKGDIVFFFQPVNPPPGLLSYDLLWDGTIYGLPK